MKKILIVDDDRIFAKVLKDGVLSSRKGQYEAMSATDGAEGFEMAKKEKPDLIMLDLVMPKMGGAEFLKKLRADDELKDTPVIVDTQLSDMAEMSKLLELGINGYILKAEMSLDQIVRQIDTVIREKENGGEADH